MRKLYAKIVNERGSERTLAASERLQTWVQTPRGRICVTLKANGTFSVSHESSTVDDAETHASRELVRGNVDTGEIAYPTPSERARRTALQWCYAAAA
jgi:hypothetical protein